MSEAELKEKVAQLKKSLQEEKGQTQKAQRNVAQLRSIVTDLLKIAAPVAKPGEPVKTALGYKVAAPERLSLPAAAGPVEMSGPRTAAPLAGPLSALGPGMYGLFGCHDIRGRGSDSPLCAHADPFMLCHAGEVPAEASLPFCAHPHCGVDVATLFFAGTGIQPWDSIQGREAKPLKPGGIYHVHTGRGCVHDEPLLPLGAKTSAFGGENWPGGNRFMQLWWFQAGDKLQPVKTALLSPEEVPEVKKPGLAIRVLAGTYGGVATSPAGLDQVLLLHVKATDAGELTLPAEMNGFAWVLEGECEVQGVPLAQGANGMVLLPPGGTGLQVTPLAGTCELFVAVGRPRRKPYYKYVGYGGGFVHTSVEAVEAAMASYEADPKGFGRDGSSQPVDWDKYEQVGGFQANDGDMMERPADVKARFKYAAKA